ncbi:MAG: zincin-like metallopeptidase domain-containing protein, partial [Desulfobulbaceae bacterium]|nr:zincin-like metallopeptidase domain-containing protein [Desulfobulbaceae bacterium]
MPAKNKSEIIAQTIIDGLKNGTAPWIKPWTPEQSIAPYNPVTGTRYKGVNFLYLATLGKPDPRWMTFKQAQQNGWQVKHGSKGTIIQFWKFGEKQDEKTDAQAENETKRERPLLRHYYVFNASDIEGIPELEKPEKNEELQRHDRADNILQQSGATINHVKGDKAAYYPLRDSIVLPEKEQFSTPDGYYATALHELGHWSGHESRLNRKISNVFGSRDYAREELRAEIASYMLGMQLGIGHDPGQHLAYVGSWIKDLEDHPTEVFRACADAEKIQSFILEFEQEQAQTREDVMEHDAPYYLITDDSFIGLTKDRQLNGDVQAGEYVRFDDPATALQAAIEAKQIHADRLENSELFIYRVNPPDDLQQDPVLVTGLPSEMRSMWGKNIGGEFPEKIVKDEIRAMPEMPVSQVDKLTGKRFLSFYANQEIDAAGNINLELQQALQRGTTIGVLRFENALERSLSEKSKINPAELSQAGIDGVVFINDGKPVAAIATDKKQLFPGMYQAAKGLKKHYLSVPYEDKDKAQKLGALWNKPAKTWYIPDGLDKKPFFKW